MQYWVKECDIDGYRCDLASWVEADFWQEARPQVDAVKPLFWLGEFDELEHKHYKPVFDCSYSWQWMHKTRKFYLGEVPLASLDTLLRQYDTTVHNSMNLWFTTNHDENSWNGTEYDKYGDMAKTQLRFTHIQQHQNFSAAIFSEVSKDIFFCISGKQVCHNCFITSTECRVVLFKQQQGFIKICQGISAIPGYRVFLEKFQSFLVG